MPERSSSIKTIKVKVIKAKSGAASPNARSPRLRLVTKANRRPVKGSKWPPAPARVKAILDGLEILYPEVKCELDHQDPFQLLCATILSAQCTDERVNKVTPQLFATFPTPSAMADAPLPVLEEIIKSTGFFRQKARSLKNGDDVQAMQILLRLAKGSLPSGV